MLPNYDLVWRLAGERHRELLHQAEEERRARDLVLNSRLNRRAQPGVPLDGKDARPRCTEIEPFQSALDIIQDGGSTA